MTKGTAVCSHIHKKVVVSLARHQRRYAPRYSINLTVASVFEEINVCGPYMSQKTSVVATATAAAAIVQVVQ